VLALTALSVVLAPAPGHAGDPASPAGTQQSDEAVASYEGGETIVIPAGTTPGNSGSSRGGGPAVEYVVVPAFGPCINDQGEASDLAGIEMRPPGTFLGTFCIGDVGTAAAPVIDYAQLQATAVSITARVRPAAPALAVEPDGRALVNQPVVFSVADPGAPPSGSDSSGAFTIVVTLGQPTYEWDFGSGWESGSRGTPYSRGARVPTEGRGNPYVSHTWTRSGGKQISVRATYTASYRVTGPGIDQVFPLAPVQSTSSAAVQVVQSRSELVRD
jgi:hypothetical protein